jgi:ankyrin repeat protein
MSLPIRHGARFEHASKWDLRWTVSRFPRVFTLLLQHGANPDPIVLEICGDQARRWTRVGHRLSTVAFLVDDCGADVNHAAADGLTPLAAAAREGLSDLVDFLLDRGAMRTPTAPDFLQPVYLARKHGHALIVERLGA